MSNPLKNLTQDKRAEYFLGALAAGVAVFVYAMLIFIVVHGWPSFSYNGLHWFGGSASLDQELGNLYHSGMSTQDPDKYDYTFHAWPLIWGTIVVCGTAAILSFFFSLFTSIFVVEFAPQRVRAVVIPAIRLLAGVPSVVYGLIGVVVLVPWVTQHLVSQQILAETNYVVPLSGYNIAVGALVLMMMIMPVMTSIFSDGLRSVPNLWKEGSMALGVSKFRTVWRVSLRAARPALVAGTVLGIARAIGEAVMLAMVVAVAGWSPNPLDGWIFWLEPTRPLASVILTSHDQVAAPTVAATLFAVAAVLLVATMLLSFIGWMIKQPLKKYGIR
ncbi:MAG: phosphate ABC transporter permease subunit PstC [Solirubrobacterales bacterium]